MKPTSKDSSWRMNLPAFDATPKQKAYDVVIIGGATMGACSAWFLASNPDFKGKVLVIEPDPTFSKAQTGASNNCMRQQFANPINVRIGQFAAEFVKNFRGELGGDPAVPELAIRNFGYLYLSDNPGLTAVLARDQKVQAENGAGTRMVSRLEIAEAYPFYRLDDIEAGSLNTRDEGYYNAPLMVEWLIRKSIERGVDYVRNSVISIGREGDRVTSVTLETGEIITAGHIVNAAGTRAGQVAAMAGLKLDIQPKRRYTFIFRARNPLDRDLPLTIDPTGVHFRQFGDDYLVGSPPMGDDATVGFDDFTAEEGIWEKKVHPILSNRIPQFRDVEIVDFWMGHYDFNTFDYNVVIGPHDAVSNFHFTNGSSGHGSQQGPAVGRGVAEQIIYGGFRSLDLTPFLYTRFAKGERVIERAVI
ncbi:glycine/D-amino acid oxidases (deaminating) (plasmid) [Sinorhizobium americanum CCGM7]|uniref:NAD(P)/FAD-dependent oxidoreductase n=1 Tax=Sinorhizobium americanum TaxID=194963 RepID=UPI000909464A|nr:FAD-binding oxidoreductase [Sinorhizobium americanum]APG87943.1 glycine/D-amino acid oxidases (deaminating) [Sinorhizobium americanum CCGM7]